MASATISGDDRFRLLGLQVITLAWMLIECALSLLSAVRAHSPALAAFGADSLVELLSAALVMTTISPRLRLSERTANRLAGVLLFALAAAVCFSSLAVFFGWIQPESSPLGIAVTLAALCIMPVLAWYKRKLAQKTRHNALAADAVQSAACAYLAAITLLGLLANALLHLPWADSVAALVAVPILIGEGRRALRGESCGCQAGCA